MVFRPVSDSYEFLISLKLPCHNACTLVTVKPKKKENKELSNDINSFHLLQTNFPRHVLF